MKIAVASLGNPRSKDTWSGIPAHLILALEKRGHCVDGISLEPAGEPWHFKWLRRFYVRLQNRWFLGSVEMSWLRKISKQLDREVELLKPEVVLVIHGDWLAYASFECPACIVHDTTFSSIVNYYPTFTNLSMRSLRMGHQMYQRALDKSVAAVFSADWASRTATSRYRVPESKVFTIPFGANIDQVPDEANVSDWIESRTADTSCNLVFIGTQWHRKGGPDCLDFVLALNKSGIHAKLTVIGCSPEVPSEMEDIVQCVGYLKKGNAADRKKFDAILQEAHAVIVLSEAECFGCVYCEANAYGLPALARLTGGVPEIIKDGLNGMLLQPDESIDSFAQRWASVWQDGETYKSMARNSYSEFVTRLNYDVFASRLEEVLSRVVQPELLIK